MEIKFFSHLQSFQLYIYHVSTFFNTKVGHETEEAFRNENTYKIICLKATVGIEIVAWFIFYQSDITEQADWPVDIGPGSPVL